MKSTQSNTVIKQLPGVCKLHIQQSGEFNPQSWN